MYECFRVLSKIIFYLLRDIVYASLNSYRYRSYVSGHSTGPFADFLHFVNSNLRVFTPIIIHLPACSLTYPEGQVPEYEATKSQSHRARVKLLKGGLCRNDILDYRIQLYRGSSSPRLVAFRVYCRVVNLGLRATRLYIMRFDHASYADTFDG